MTTGCKNSYEIRHKADKECQNGFQVGYKTNERLPNWAQMLLDNPLIIALEIFVIMSRFWTPRP